MSLLINSKTAFIQPFISVKVMFKNINRRTEQYLSSIDNAKQQAKHTAI